MPRRKKNQALIDVLEDLLVLAKAGEITDAFVLSRFRNGEYAPQLETNDFDGMVLQLRTEIMCLRDRQCRPPALRN